jgi:hypothetical protein
LLNWDSKRMVVRIRLSSGTRIRQKRRKNQHVALALASLLTPASVMAFVLAFWRVAADLNATGKFPIPDGLFSHWQVWLTLAGSLQFCATLLNRYGKPDVILPETVDEPEHKLPNSRILIPFERP